MSWAVDSLLVGVAGLITSLGTLITAAAAWRKSAGASEAAAKASTAATLAAKELSPNHGSSMKDSITRIEEMIRLQGQQISEIRKDAAITAESTADALADVRRRLNRIEER